MKHPTFFSLKCIIALPVSILLALSAVSANFYDPTFFNQLNQHARVQNWCGIVGSYSGGSLVELFGPAALFVPWFILKLSFSSKNYLSRISTSYVAVILLFSVSIAHQLWWPISLTELANSSLLRYPGYAGITGAHWLELTLGTGMTNFLTGVIIVICTIKLFDELPFKMFISAAIHVGIILPSYLLKQIWRSLIQRNSIEWSALFSWFKPNQPSSLPSFPLDPDSRSGDPMANREETSP